MCIAKKLSSDATDMILNKFPIERRNTELQKFAGRFQQFKQLETIFSF